MKVSRFSRLILMMIFIPFFALYSYWLVVPTIYGDAASYQALYDALSVANFDEIRRLGISFVSSREFTPYIIWIGARLGIEKDIYITFFNVILLSGLLLFVYDRKISLTTIFFSILIITNFYIVVLMTSAERLKFAYVFLILAAISKDRMKSILFISSIAMHFQAVLLVIGQSIYLYSGKLKERLLNKGRSKNKKNIFRFFIFFILGSVFLIYLKDGLLIKAEGYIEKSNSGIGELVQLFLLFIASIFLVHKKKFEICTMFIFYAFAILLIGGSRVNMIAYTSVVYIVLSEGVLNRFTVRAIPFLLISMYLSFKSIGYIERTFIQGHGWVL